MIVDTALHILKAGTKQRFLAWLLYPPVKEPQYQLYGKVGRPWDCSEWWWRERFLSLSGIESW